MVNRNSISDVICTFNKMDPTATINAWKNPIIKNNPILSMYILSALKVFGDLTLILIIATEIKLPIHMILV